MKTISKQAEDHTAVKKYLAANSGTTLRQAIIAVAGKKNKKVGTVQASYYRVEKKNRPAVVKPKVTKVAVKKDDLDLNILRASLKDAIHAIDLLEKQNERNDRIVSDLRKALNV